MLTVSFTFGWRAPTGPFPADKIEALRSLVRGPQDVVDDKGELQRYSVFTCDLEAVARDCRWALPFMDIQDTASAQSLDLVLSEIRRVADRVASATRLNERCSIHMPGNGLLVITEVRVETNCCTDSLNTLLGEGWRILAVCPQPDQRRPDYVLGRSPFTATPEPR